MLELGVGTGETTRRLLERYPDAEVTGLDAQPEMVFKARELGIEVRLARMEDPLPDGPWDLVVSVLSVHHLDDDGKRDLFRRVREQSRAMVMGDVVIADPQVTPLEAGVDLPVARRGPGGVVLRRARLAGRRPGGDPRRLRLSPRWSRPTPASSNPRASAPMKCHSERSAMSKLIYEKRDRIAYLTINRPEARNAIDPDVHRLMIEAWADFRDDDSVDVAILTGAGEAFCAGADLKTYIPPIIGDASPARDPRDRRARPERLHPRHASDRQADHRGDQRLGARRRARDRAGLRHPGRLGAGDVRLVRGPARLPPRRRRHRAPGQHLRGRASRCRCCSPPSRSTPQRALACNMVTKVVPHERLMEEAELVAPARSSATRRPPSARPSRRSST